MNKLRPIPKKGRIAVTAPSSRVDKERLARGIKRLEAEGYQVVVGDSCYSSYHYLSAPDHQRAEELMHFFRNPDIDAIICARGGYGSIRILPLLDFEEIASARKLLMGYSDITALSWAIVQKCNIPCVNGSMVAADFGENSTTEASLNQALDLLQTGRIDIRWRSSRTARFDARAPLFAGTLSVMATLMGSPYEPSLDHSILMIEDIGEPSRKIDGYLQNLHLSKRVDTLAALLIGDFDGRQKADEADYPFDLSLESLSKTHKFPIHDSLPFGHIANKRSFPIGYPLNIEINGHDGRLYSDESIFED